MTETVTPNKSKYEGTKEKIYVTRRNRDTGIEEVAILDRYTYQVRWTEAMEGDITDFAKKEKAEQFAQMQQQMQSFLGWNFSFAIFKQTTTTVAEVPYKDKPEKQE